MLAASGSAPATSRSGRVPTAPVLHHRRPTFSAAADRRRSMPMQQCHRRSTRPAAQQSRSKQQQQSLLLCPMSFVCSRRCTCRRPARHTTHGLTTGCPTLPLSFSTTVKASTTFVWCSPTTRHATASPRRRPRLVHRRQTHCQRCVWRWYYSRTSTRRQSTIRLSDVVLMDRLDTKYPLKCNYI